MFEQSRILELATPLMESAEYYVHSDMKDLPNFVSCWSFVKWLYEQLGILLPEIPVDQYDFMVQHGIPVEPAALEAGDLVFRTGKRKLPSANDVTIEVGHVGIALTPDRILHATPRLKGIGEDTLQLFIGPWKFVGGFRLNKEGLAIS